jgi:hypothetical protein
MPQQIEEQTGKESRRQHPPPAVLSPADGDERGLPVTLRIFHHGNWQERRPEGSTLDEPIIAPPSITGAIKLGRTGYKQ